MKKNYPHYPRVVEWSQEDGCYVGTSPGLLLGGVHGDSPLKVASLLETAIQDALDILKQQQREIPKAISAALAQRAIDSCDRLTAIGRRDRAVLLLLARLGLRACEIIRLTLDDIDWDQAQLHIRGKGGRQSLLPLPADVGIAIAAYLQQGRPTCEDRHVFLRSMAPIRCLLDGSDGVGSIVNYALARANVNAPHRGSHQFRHALAAHMLRQGASLIEIGQVLRHRSPQTTSIYAKVDLEALRTLAVAWPGGAI